MTLPSASLSAPAPAPTARAYRAVLGAALGPHRGRAALLMGLVLVDIALDLAGPQIQRAFLDGALSGAPIERLLGLAGAFVALALLTQGLYVAASYLAADLAQRATNRLRERLLAHVLGLDLGFHARHTPGALVERIDGDVATLGNFVSRFLLELVGSALLAVGVLVMVARVDPRIALVLAAFAATAVVVMRALLGLAVGRWEAAREAAARQTGFLEEHLVATEDIRANGAVHHVVARLYEHARAVWRRGVVAGLFGSATGGTSTLMLALGMALALGMGLAGYRRGELTLGTVYLLLAYAQLLDGPLQGIARQLQDLQQAGAGIARIAALEATSSALSPPPRGAARRLPRGPLSAELEGVTFRYADDRPPALSDLTLAIPAGGSLGLLGRTGSGKSTVARLLLRLHDVGPGPAAGAVRLGGVDVRLVPPEDLRRRVALVTQEVELFEASLRDNLTLFDPAVDDARLGAVLDELGLADWVAALPGGLDAPLAPGGATLSAGEAQLIALARAFLASPGLVVLDEASSRLDPQTERRLTGAIGRLTAGRTVVVIAHRLATVRAVDHIALLDGGRLVAHGARAAMAADPSSTYARLLAAGHADLDAALEALLPARTDEAPLAAGEGAGPASAGARDERASRESPADPGRAEDAP